MKTCPYCGKEYPIIDIPSPFKGGRPLRIPSNKCGCEGETMADADEERRREEQSFQDAWEKCGVPDEYKDVEPNFKALDNLNGLSLYAHGDFGTGKTTMAAGILKAFVMRDHKDGYAPARFLTAYDWLASMRTSNWGLEENAFQRAAGIKFLVFDDIGKGKQTDWAVERIARLVDIRTSNGRQTIYTSNYSIGALGDRCRESGDDVSAGAMVSRLSSKKVLVLTMNGIDHRLA